MKNLTIASWLSIFLMAVCIYEMNRHMMCIEKENERVEKWLQYRMDIFDECLDEVNKNMRNKP
jgi:UDP-glucose 6-dehydrogenase